jgi:hypothetical protein
MNCEKVLRLTPPDSVPVSSAAPGMEAAVWRDAQSTTGSNILWTWQFMNPLIHGKTHSKIQDDLRRSFEYWIRLRAVNPPVQYWNKT